MQDASKAGGNKEKKNPMKLKIGFWVALASGLVAYTLISLFPLLPIDNRYMWMGMIPMMMYFATGSSLDKRTYARMFGSFACGLIWGQVANWIFQLLFPVSPELTGVLATGVLIFAMILVHMGLLKGTVFDFLPCIYLGFAYTTGFWGRPFPFEGLGYMGAMSVPEGMLTLFGLFTFGMVFAFLIDLLSAVFIKNFVAKRRKAASPATQAAEGGIESVTAGGQPLP